MNSWQKGLIAGVFFSLLAGCQSHPTDKGQQYKDGKMHSDLQQVNQVNVQGRPINAPDFNRQVTEIQNASPRLFNSNNDTYHAIENWLMAGGDPAQLSRFNLSAFQMEGMDNYGNVQFTGYYTPVIEARRSPQGDYQHPLYGMPSKGKKRLPSRAQIYNGALSNNLILAYSNSPVDNFMMEVQGSGYVDFGDGSPLNFFAYAGKNGHAYKSIGKVLVDRGEVPLEKMSLQAIHDWTNTHSEQEVRELLESNPSFVFFKPQSFVPVRGASAVPLVAKASVASDKTLIPPGTALLAEVPVLDSNGKFTGRYEMRMMVALDVGGAIKGHHFDIYHGTGHEAGKMAGFYNHYGRVWVLKKSQPVFSAM
ncbi:TPA: murein transglycosylase A [Providencia alcalifaciens]|uniref:Membrane-bound lytic murein transglycosylase A n=3 Tax=Providencia alcalifaciens TaxID=126385 RepID=A0AAW9VCI6_9GAMM|nr:MULTISPECIES: murein transglycosylase A [Providencia]ATG16287.1 murein transglycosylase A [Providencia alcalifaciens]EEB44786.1 MltA specific insert domain protein [Providencia alcalifaciens DSM 30120]ETT04007.1 membrane-bound lytic murein transglycosylase A [Providencia alcalifaciens F90-2004]EUC96268.1 membrane-bound lytic murein transglycosylase A [Providencia alcalifaciens PAL-2]EUD01616.1 membrane-bound lytic murein transglycosylase A [Providencia alcalifaciens RIMD 1656011]